jgi:hypothetical protein
VTDVPEHPYGDGAPPVARASPPDNGAAFFMPPVLEWSSKKMAYITHKPMISWSSSTGSMSRS